MTISEGYQLQASELDYELPERLIAKSLAEPRDSARLLVDQPGLEPLDRTVSNLPELLGPGDVLVINTTQTRRSRLRITLPDGTCTEMLAIESVGTDGDWVVRFPPAAAPGQGRYEIAGDSAWIEVREPDSEIDCWIARFCAPDGDVDALLERVGQVPMPPYAESQQVDASRARATFGRVMGSAAPPTASLHFTPEILDGCRQAGATVAEIVLHVSLRRSRYRLVNIQRPVLHSESFEIPDATIEACRSARRRIALGTTVVRALESFAATGDRSGRTSIFIRRGHQFQMIDSLITNFQPPRSTMLAMIDAFIGTRWKELYSAGLERGYRFLSLGDATLLHRT